MSYQAPLRHCLGRCGKRRRRWKEWKCGDCTQRDHSIQDNECFKARQAERFAAMSPLEAPQYDATGDPWYGMEAIASSIGLIGGATIRLETPDRVDQAEQLELQL